MNLVCPDMFNMCVKLNVANNQKHRETARVTGSKGKRIGEGAW